VLLSQAEVVAGVLHIEVAPASPGAHKLKLIGTNGKPLAQTEGRSASFSLAQAPPGYARAVVEDGQGRKAWLQPIRVPRE
jgi:hypothetical protein